MDEKYTKQRNMMLGRFKHVAVILLLLFWWSQWRNESALVPPAAEVLTAAEVERNVNSTAPTGAWPFRHAHRNMNPFDLLGSSPRNPAAVCELMILGHPLCDAFLTGELAWSNEEGPMIECLERYGVKEWDRYIQPQCSRSTFWQTIVERLGKIPPKEVLSDPHDLMDPVMRLHVGRLKFPSIPPQSRTYAKYHKPLQCHGPAPTVAEASAIKKLREVSLDGGLEVGSPTSFSMLEVDDEHNTTFSSGPRSVGGPLLIHPLGLSVPSKLFVRRVYRHKLFDWFPLIPAYYPYFRPKLFRGLPRRVHFAASAADEYVSILLMRLSYFGWTHARGGAECSRHYELLASGCVPYFADLSLMPPWSVSGLPRDLLAAALNLTAVQHIPKIETLIPLEDFDKYRQSRIPEDVELRRLKDLGVLIDRQLRRLERQAEEDILWNASGIASEDAEHVSDTIRAWIDEEQQLEAEPLVRSYVPPASAFRSRRNSYFVRIGGEQVVNFLRIGDLAPDKFDSSSYFELADKLLNFTSRYLTDAALASYFLREIGIEEPTAVLMFVSPKVDYSSASLARGLGELGLKIDVCVQQEYRSATLFSAPIGPDTKLRADDTFRLFDELGAVPPMDSATYDAWRKSEQLNSMYGKNFFVGRRSPKQNQLTEVDACQRIADGAYDTVILSYGHWYQRFPLHVCAPQLRKRNRSTMKVAFLMGHDGVNIETLRSYHEEGIMTFAREPRCW